MLRSPFPAKAGKPDTQPGGLALLAAVTVIAGLWLGVWPRLADWSPLRAQIERNRVLGIDPSAKFYTEHEATADAYHGISALQRQNPSAWWVPETKPRWRR